mgnify:FL=1
MAGAALRGMGKVLGKHLRKVPVLGKHVKKARGTPTKAGLVARRSALRGDPIPKGVKAPKRISKVDFGVGAGTGALTMHLINKAKKEAKAKEDNKKEKLTKSVEEHKKKTKEQKEKQKK